MNVVMTVATMMVFLDDSGRDSSSSIQSTTVHPVTTQETTTAPSGY